MWQKVCNYLSETCTALLHRTHCALPNSPCVPTLQCSVGNSAVAAVGATVVQRNNSAGLQLCSHCGRRRWLQAEGKNITTGNLAQRCKNEPIT